MEGNKICRQIQWYSNPDHLAAWREGRTGYPWIDAICRQMVIEGTSQPKIWIKWTFSGHTHHIARYAQASFLCLGDLWLNWTDGQEAFEEYLLDGDYAMNAGCWMWCTGSAFSETIPERYIDCSNEYHIQYISETLIQLNLVENGIQMVILSERIVQSFD